MPRPQARARPAGGEKPSPPTPAKPKRPAKKADRSPARPAKTAPDARVARLSHNLEALLKADLRRQKVPAGMAQCPGCGTLIDPTRTKAIRTHFDPMTGSRCSASTRAWSAFGERAPKSVRKRAGPTKAGKPLGKKRIAESKAKKR